MSDQPLNNSVLNFDIAVAMEHGIHICPGCDEAIACREKYCDRCASEIEAMEHAARAAAQFNKQPQMVIAVVDLRPRFTAKQVASVLFLIFFIAVIFLI